MKSFLEWTKTQFDPNVYSPKIVQQGFQPAAKATSLGDIPAKALDWGPMKPQINKLSQLVNAIYNQVADAVGVGKPLEQGIATTINFLPVAGKPFSQQRFDKFKQFVQMWNNELKQLGVMPQIQQLIQQTQELLKTYQNSGYGHAVK